MKEALVLPKKSREAIAEENNLTEDGLASWSRLLSRASDGLVTVTGEALAVVS